MTRDGDDAVIEYADPKIAPTRFKVGAERLAAMSDAELLECWNDDLQASEDLGRSPSSPPSEIPVQATEDLSRSQGFTATEVPLGKPQVKYEPMSDQWVPRGHVVRAVILTDAAAAVDLEGPFVSIDDRAFTVAEFVKMVGSFGGWGMRITFVPDGEIHEKPTTEVREPEEKKRPSRRVKSKPP